MEPIKEAFNNVKQDMDSIKEEVDLLKNELSETRNTLIEICELFKKYVDEPSKDTKSSYNQDLDTSTQDSTHRHIIPTSSTDTSTNNADFKPLNDQILPISTGNRGAPTDRQTNRQTDKQAQNNHIIPKKGANSSENNYDNSIDDAVEILDSLDNLKKEIRLKFKKLTEQEFLVFSTLYQLTEQEGYSTYASISNKLKLTESSIRDYVGRLIKKGIPVEKTKINNKNIQLFISPNLLKVANLSTILQLRGI